MPIPKKKVLPKQKKVANAKIAKIASFLEDQVMDNLGKPESFDRVKAHHLWEEYYRINVWSNGVISDSFFIRGTFDGILTSSPDIKKKYEGD